MICSNCGAQVNDGMTFCSKCGAQVQSTSAAPAPTATGSSDASPKKKRPIAIIIGIIAAVIIVIVAFFVWQNLAEQDRLKHAPHPVIVSVNAPGYTDEDTLIPVMAIGKDADNKDVSQLFFVNAAGEGITMTAGEYGLKVVASPLTIDGVLFDYLPDKVPLTIPSNLQPDEVCDFASTVTINLTKKTALAETDSEIQNAYDRACEEPSQEQKANALKEVAVRAHADAVAAEQARAEAEARAQKQRAGRYFDCPFYTIDFPDSFNPSYKIDAAHSQPIKINSGFGIGYGVNILGTPGSDVAVTVFTSNWGPQGEFDSINLGYAKDGCNVVISAADVNAGGLSESENMALMKQISQYITLKH